MSIGRGRGRGKSNSSISVISENLGIGRGDIGSLSAPIQPRETFPPLKRQPQPLLESNHHNYLIALKQEFRNYMRESPYHIQPETKRSKIERYSDRFKQFKTHKELEWVPKWNMFPAELRMRTSKSAKQPEIKPRMVGHRQDHSDINLLKRLDKHQESEKNVNDDDEVESEDDFQLDDETDDIDVDLDYVQNYYDDDYNAFDDDADEGPTM